MKPFLNRFVQACIILGMVAGVVLLIDIFVFEMPIVSVSSPKEASRICHGAVRRHRGAVLSRREYIAITLFCMMRTLEKDPFVQQNVDALRRMGFAAIIIALLGIGTLLLHPVPLAVIAAVPVAMCRLFSLVLSRVFAQAVAHKLENDLTV
ncbi:MAG: DUF2975 domain-containing protein [Eubacteriales bacterium]